MKILPDPTKPDGPTRIASLPPFYRFYSNTQYRNHMAAAAALARQTTISNQVIRANCNITVRHKARVEACVPGHYVAMDVRFQRDQATDTIPTHYASLSSSSQSSAEASRISSSAL